MTDITSQPIQEIASRTHKPPKAEFMTYFAVIFLATLPLSLFTWALGVMRTASFNRPNPVRSAWSQARIITPMIFQG